MTGYLFALGQASIASAIIAIPAGFAINCLLLHVPLAYTGPVMVRLIVMGLGAV